MELGRPAHALRIRPAIARDCRGGASWEGARPWGIVEQALNLDIVREIIRTHLDDLGAFAEWAVGRAG
jgi:hypothetical protein